MGRTFSSNADEFGVGDSGASESMNADATRFPRLRAVASRGSGESADGKFILVVGYGRPCLRVDQEDGIDKGGTQQLTREGAANVPDGGSHNLVSAKALARSLNTPMRVYPPAAVDRSRHGTKPLTFKTLRPDSCLRSRLAGAPSPGGSGRRPSQRSIEVTTRCKKKHTRYYVVESSFRAS